MAKKPKQTRTARPDRRPVAATLIWDIITANDKAVVAFLGEVGLPRAEADKQYHIWRTQAKRGLVSWTSPLFTMLARRNVPPQAALPVIRRALMDRIEQFVALEHDLAIIEARHAVR